MSQWHSPFLAYVAISQVNKLFKDGATHGKRPCFLLFSVLVGGNLQPYSSEAVNALIFYHQSAKFPCFLSPPRRSRRRSLLLPLQKARKKAEESEKKKKQGKASERPGKQRASDSKPAWRATSARTGIHTNIYRKMCVIYNMIPGGKSSVKEGRNRPPVSQYNTTSVC